jgi:hypothetical protein
MATVFYLQIPSIPGDSKDPHHVDWHVLKSFVPADRSEVFKGRYPPHAGFYFLFASRPGIKAQKLLVDAAQNHKRFKSIVCDGWRDNKQVFWMTLFDAAIEGIYLADSGSGGDEKQETIVVSYGSASSQNPPGPLSPQLGPPPLLPQKPIGR